MTRVWACFRILLKPKSKLPPLPDSLARLTRWRGVEKDDGSLKASSKIQKWGSLVIIWRRPERQALTSAAAAAKAATTGKGWPDFRFRLCVQPKAPPWLWGGRGCRRLGPPERLPAIPFPVRW